MATNSTPVSAWVATVMAATGVNQSASVTATINITAAWEIQIPVRCQFSNVSADPIINIYSSMDGGAGYDTTPIQSFAIARIASGTGQASIRLTTGQYAIQILNSGPNSATVSLVTALAITAINNA